MIENSASLPIGVFDSGVGGISVLADLIHQLPNEQYIYFGDSGNAPYGVRSKEEVKKLSFNVVDKLLNFNIKAVVVACNTATSIVIEELRKRLDIPVIGMEPALKPAIELNNFGKIVVMATPVTLREKKFNDLIMKLTDTDRVVKMPCPGLVEIIEQQGDHDAEIEAYIRRIYASYQLDAVGTVVLGCTHYVFIKDMIAKVVGPEATVIDGNFGTARHVKELLKQSEALNTDGTYSQTSVRIMNSSKDASMIALSQSLLEKRLKDLNWCGTIKYI